MAKKTHLPPAELVVARFGGIRPLAKLMDRDPSTISRWITRGEGKIPNSSRGDGDTHLKLLELAKQKKIQLTAEELVIGGYP